MKGERKIRAEIKRLRAERVQCGYLDEYDQGYLDGLLAAATAFGLKL